MNVRKNANGRYSITNVTEDELTLLIAGLRGGASYMRIATAPHSSRPGAQAEVRAKMDEKAAEFSAMASTIERVQKS